MAKKHRQTSRADLQLLRTLQDNAQLNSATISSRRITAECSLAQTEIQITRLSAELADARHAHRDLLLYIEGLTTVLSARAI